MHTPQLEFFAPSANVSVGLIRSLGTHLFHSAGPNGHGLYRGFMEVTWRDQKIGWFYITDDRICFTTPDVVKKVWGQTEYQKFNQTNWLIWVNADPSRFNKGEYHAPAQGVN